jgi:hypothetical protein
MANNVTRDIKYLNKDFNTFRNTLINYAKTYFPTTYNDFTPSSVGMMFMEMSSYIGDVLSFYLDNQIEETFVEYARENKNLFALAYMLGYKPKVTSVALTNLDIYQQVPALGTSPYSPDYDYCVYMGANTQVTNNISGGPSFLIQDSVDFSFSSSTDPTEVSVYSINGGNPEYYLLKKTRKAISATINSTTFSFGNYQSFQTVELNQANIIKILDITDSEGNTWYEVPYLGQELIPVPVRNVNTNDPNFAQYGDNTPYLLKYRKEPKRFVTRFLNSTTLQIQFGSGNPADTAELITPNPDNVGLGLPFEQDKLTTAFDPSNFLYTNTYGIAPVNTTLTVRYLTGGGATANAAAGTLTNLNTNNVQFLNSNLNSAIANYVFNSVATNNLLAADGGGDGDTMEQIRQNALLTHQTQLRNVTQDDYLVRALSMSSEYGNVSKVYVESQKASSLLPGQLPSTVDLYVLSQDINGYLSTASPALKQNLSTYLSQYRIVNDFINIKDGFIINIGVNFEIIVLPNYNSNNVLFLCINALKTYFNTNNWQINQPIIVRDLYLLLDAIDGVQTVKNVTITNKVGTSIGYSQYAYDIPGATINNIIYPSIDPMIFEVKYPDNDIQGRVVTL